MFSELPGVILFIGILIAVVITAGEMNIFGITRFWIRLLLIIGSLAAWSLYGLGVYLSFCTCGIGLGRDVLTLENGMFQKVITWIPYQKIQQLQYVEGPISRRLGLAKGIVFVLASVLNSMHKVSYFKLAVFDELHEKIMERQGRKENLDSE